MVDLAQIKDISILRCRDCPKFMLTVFYQRIDDGTKHCFVYCPNSLCRYAYEVSEKDELYQKLYIIRLPKSRLRVTTRDEKREKGKRQWLI